MSPMPLEAGIGSPPLLRPVDEEEAARLSPWPFRLAGREAWQPSAKRSGSARAEYDSGWYADLLDAWQRFLEAAPPAPRHPGMAFRFFDALRRANNAAMQRHPEIYGDVSLDAYLVSAADQLYAADLNVFEAWWRNLLVERVAWAHEAAPFGTLAEIGCGSGVNLLTMYSRLPVNRIAGCDISPNAVDAVRRIASDLAIPAAMRVGDFLQPETLQALVPASGSWALLSVHALEQVARLGMEWFERVVALQPPPAIAVHCEPIQWGDGSPFAMSCARYAALNGYNQDLAAASRAAESAGLIRTIRTERRVLGHSAYNPTSILMWVPARSA